MNHLYLLQSCSCTWNSVFSFLLYQHHIYSSIRWSMTRTSVWMSRHVDLMYKLIDTVLLNLARVKTNWILCDIGSSCQKFPRYFLHCMGTFLSTCVPYYIICIYQLYFVYDINDDWLTKISLIFPHCIWNALENTCTVPFSTSLGLSSSILTKFI